MVRHRREADRPGHNRADAYAFAESLATEGQHLVVLEPERLDQVGARAGLLVLDVTGVGDLAPALGIEGRLLELRLEGAVAEIRVGEDRRQHLSSLVADELRARRRAADLDVDVESRAPPRALPLLLHQTGELLLVDLESPFGRELLRQLPGEPVGVVQAEGVLRRDLAFRHHLLEELLAPRERLAETLLLGSDQVGDLALTFLELGVDGAHLAADDAGELVQERRLEAKAAAELDRTANHPAKHV